MRLYPFLYAPPSYPFRSFSDYYPRSTHPEDSPHRVPRSSVIDIPVVDHRSSSSPSPPASHAPPRPSESRPPSVPSPSTYPKRAFSDSTAATIIQARFRGFSIRRRQPLLHLRSVATARHRLEDLKAALESPEFVQRLRTDDKERLRVTEAIMTIILNLDAIEGSITDVRLRRKEATRMAISLQDMVDAIALQDEHGASDVNQENEDHSCANGEYEPVLESEKDDLCSKIVELQQEVTDLDFSQIESLPEESLLLDRKSNGALIFPHEDGVSTMEKDGSAIISAYPSENASYAQVICSEQGDVQSLYKSNDVLSTGDIVLLKDEGTVDLSGHPSETAATTQIECTDQDAVQSMGKSKEMLPEKDDVTSTSDIDTAALTGSSSENGCSDQAECAEQCDESAITEQTKYTGQIVAGPGCDSFELPLHKDSVTQMKEDSSGVVGGYSSDNAGNAQIKCVEQCSMQSECGCLKECLSRRGSIIALDEMAPDRLPFKPSIPGAGCAGAFTLSSQNNENLHCGDDEEHHENTHRLTPDVMCMSALGRDRELALDNLREGATLPCSLGNENVSLKVTNFCTKYEKNCDEMHNAPTSQCEGFTPENYALQDNAHSHYHVDHCQVKDCSKFHENADIPSSENGLQRLIEDNKQLKHLLGKLLLQSRAQSKVICALGERLEMLEHQQQKLISSQQSNDRNERERKYPKKKSSKLRRRPSFFEPLE